MARFRILAVSLALAALAACSDRPEADLVILAGQSNALGYGLAVADLPAGLNQPDAQARIWRDGRFEPLRPGANTGSPNRPDAWGPEVAFARAWRTSHPDRPLYVLKLARGSTSLAPTDGRDWAPSSGELFAETAAEAQAAKAALAADGLTPRVTILWVQGEADAVEAASAAAYRANLTGLIQAMRRDWAGPNTPVVLAQIPRIGGHADQVRAAQAAVDAADPLTVAVDTAGLPLQADGLHIAAAGQVRLGEALARAALPLSR